MLAPDFLKGGIAMNATFDGRIILKHDTEANWNAASTFVPMQGEMVVYNPDDTCTYARVKVGDGETKICDLPFAWSEWGHLNWRGEWSADEAYSGYDVVQHNGSAYIVPEGLAVPPNIEPGTDEMSWNLLVAKGANGQGFNWRGEWSADETYSPYDVVQHDGSAYIVPDAGDVIPGESSEWTGIGFDLFVAGSSGNTNGDSTAASLSKCTVKISITSSSSGTFTVELSDGTGFSLPIYTVEHYSSSGDYMMAYTSPIFKLQIKNSDVSSLYYPFGRSSASYLYRYLVEYVFPEYDIIDVILNDNLSSIHPIWGRASNYYYDFNGGLCFSFSRATYRFSEVSADHSGADEPE